MKAGIYILLLPVKGDANGWFFPAKSKVYIGELMRTPKGYMREIEGFTNLNGTEDNNIFTVDYIGDPDTILAMATTPQPTKGIDLSDKAKRMNYLRKG